MCGSATVGGGFCVRTEVRLEVHLHVLPDVFELEIDDRGVVEEAAGYTCIVSRNDYRTGEYKQLLTCRVYVLKFWQLAFANFVDYALNALVRQDVGFDGCDAGGGADVCHQPLCGLLVANNGKYKVAEIQSGDNGGCTDVSCRANDKDGGHCARRLK